MFKHTMMTALFVLLAGLAVTACVAPTPVADQPAPVIVAPFQIEVVVGDEQAMERVYYNFGQGEPATFGNHEAIVLRSDPGYASYVFPHPQRADTWIVVTDWVTEFPGREAQAAVAAPVLPELLASFVFTQ